MISVIIPVYNAENNIRKCIISVLNQTYKDFELILVNDGSVDNSLSICKEFEKEYDNIHVISQKNKGVSVARNRGIVAAKGEYIQFVDSDDYIDPYMLEKLFNAITKYKVDFVICGFYEGCNIVKNPVFCGCAAISELQLKYPDIFEKFILNPPFNKLYKRSKVKSLFPIGLSMGEDLLFNLEYLKNIDSIYFLDEPLYYYKITEESLSRKYLENSIEIAERLYIASLNCTYMLKLGDKSKVDISSIFIKFFFYGLSDLYMRSGKSNKEIKDCLLSWTKNQNVKDALKIARMPQLKQKIAQLLLKHNMIFFFDIMMKVKRIISRKW